MGELAEVLYDLVKPMVDKPEDLAVEEASDNNDDEIVLLVKADNSDIARLIGKKGSMASALRQVMSVASHTEGKKVSIKFEQIQDA